MQDRDWGERQGVYGGREVIIPQKIGQLQANGAYFKKMVPGTCQILPDSVYLIVEKKVRF
jgi:hypothetical protein